MRRDTYVRIIPLRPSQNLIVDFIDGKPMPRRKRPISFGHWLEGCLQEDLRPGAQIWFDGCHLRNGKLVEETWRSSPVIYIVADHVYCDRARYRILAIPPFDYTDLYRES